MRRGIMPSQWSDLRWQAEKIMCDGKEHQFGALYSSLASVIPSEKAIRAIPQDERHLDITLLLARGRRTRLQQLLKQMGCIGNGVEAASIWVMPTEEIQRRVIAGINPSC